MQNFLGHLDCFKSVPQNSLVPLFPKKIPKGETIFSEGDPPEAAFLLKSGLIKSVKFTLHENPSTIDFIMPGQLFGMIAVLDNKNYPVSTIAIRDSEIYRLSTTLFHDFISRYPEFRKEVFRQLGNHLRNSQALRTMMQESVDRRVAHILNYLSETMGMEIQLSRDDIAAMAGCTESTAVRTLIDFRKKKIIQTGWKYLKIISPQKLKALLS